MPSGHLQDKKLRELLGEVKAGDIVNAGSGLVVESVEADRYGGLRIGLTERLCLSVFPASNTQMEWILIRPGGGGLVLMKGLLNRTRRKPRTPRI